MERVLSLWLQLNIERCAHTCTHLLQSLLEGIAGKHETADSFMGLAEQVPLLLAMCSTNSQNGTPNDGCVLYPL